MKLLDWQQNKLITLLIGKCWHDSGGMSATHKSRISEVYDRYRCVKCEEMFNGSNPDYSFGKSDWFELWKFVNDSMGFLDYRYHVEDLREYICDRIWYQWKSQYKLKAYLFWQGCSNNCYRCNNGEMDNAEEWCCATNHHILTPLGQYMKELEKGGTGP